MSDPNRPRQSPSGSQRWREDDQRGQQRASRSSSRSNDDYTRPPGSPQTRLPSRDNNRDNSRDGGRESGKDGGSRSRSRDAGRDGARYDDAPPRSPNRTRSSRSRDDGDDGWNDPKWRAEDDRPDRGGSRSGRDGSARATRDIRDGWDDEAPRAPRRHGSSAGGSRRDERGGPRGWDDNRWQSENGGWDDDAWGPAEAPAGRRGAALAEDDSNVWQPPSRRQVQGRNAAARAGAAWKDATSFVMAAVKRPSTFRERLRSDRKTQVIAAIMLIVILVCMIPTPILAYSNTMGLAKDGIAHLKNAENDFKTLATSPTNLATINDAQNELQLAHNDFAQLQLRVGVLAPLGLLPKVGSKVSGANKLAPLAAEGTQAGVLACDAMKILVTGMKNPLGTTGGLTSADTDRIASDFDQIHTLYGQMEPILAGLTQSDLSLDPGLWPTVSSLQAKLPQVNQLMDDANGMAHALPQLLGIGKPATYLVLVLDSSELRPTGGFIGNFGALVLDSGRLQPKFNVSDITLIDGSVKFPTGTGPGTVTYSHDPIPIPDKYAWLKSIFKAGGTDSWSVRDSNLDPDYPTTAKYALSLYQELVPVAQQNVDVGTSNLKLYDPSKSGQFAGVVTLSLGFFANALAITGPVEVNDHTIHETINAQNFVSKIHYYALSAASGSGPDSQVCGVTSCAKVFTSDVVAAFMAKLKLNLSADLGKMGKLFYDSLHTKDIEVYLTPQAAEQTLLGLNIGSAVESPQGSDTVFEVDANIGANKDNYYMQYNMADQIALDDGGDAAHNLTWTYGWQKGFCDSSLVFPAGDAKYHSYSRVFVPPNAVVGKQSNLDGFGTDKPSNDSFGLEVFHGDAYAAFPYSCGSNYTYPHSVSWKVPGIVTHDGAGYHYQLLFQREAGITWPLTLTVTLPKCVTTATPPTTSGLDKTATVTAKGNVVTITGPLTQNEKLQFDWNC
jgi:hypothetical protein